MAKQFMVVMLRGARGEGHEGAIVERGIAEGDLAERERFWHDTHAPCETFTLPDGEDATTIDASEHHAVVPPPDTSEADAEAERVEAEREAERIARVTAS